MMDVTIKGIDKEYIDAMKDMDDGLRVLRLILDCQEEIQLDFQSLTYFCTPTIFHTYQRSKTKRE